jgi:hypothetical protein
MKNSINETKRMQQLAGLITESQSNEVDKLLETRQLVKEIIKEELYDFIQDFKSTEGRPPTKDEINKLYYGKSAPFKGNFYGSVKTYKKAEKTPAEIENEKAEIDVITNELVNMNYFEPSDVISGKMLSSFSKGKKVHNEDIRKAIEKIGKDKGLSDSVIEKYWDKFW